jgi:hypothetical protein
VYWAALIAVVTGDAPATGAITRLVKLRSVTGDITLTSQEAVLPPSVVVTVIVAVPGPTAVTVPLLTVATLLLLDDQLTALFVALLGFTVAVRVPVEVPPMVRVRLVWFRLTLLTGVGGGGLTVTAQVAVCPPSWVVTVIVAVPAATAVTVPLFTVATAGLFDDQLIAGLVAFAGTMLADRVVVPPGVRFKAVVFSLTPVTGWITVTAQDAVLLPSAVVTMIVAVPAATAVTVPLFTEATPVLVEVHDTAGFAALDGLIAAVSVTGAVCPIVNCRLDRLRLTPVTAPPVF